jgi:hypothetical protein
MNPPEPPMLPTEQSPTRHGCLTAWLIFMIVANSATALITPFTLSGMREAGLTPSSVTIGIIILCAVANVGFAIALLRWHKWAFYGFIVTSIIAFAINISIGIGVGRALVGLIGVALLYLMLNIGGEKKAWPRLK